MSEIIWINSAFKDFLFEMPLSINSVICAEVSDLYHYREYVTMTTKTSNHGNGKTLDVNQELNNIEMNHNSNNTDKSGDADAQPNSVAIYL